jgi:hypothetical protein
MAAIFDIGFCYVLALTGAEKLRAISNFDQQDSMLTNKWFVLLMASIVFVLTIVLLGVRRLRIERDRESSQRRFREQADRRGLTSDERALLEMVSMNAAIIRKEAIFSMMPAFNRGAARLMQQHFAISKSIEDRRQFNARLSSVKEKLGFNRRTYSFGVRSRGTKGLSSRNIMVGKTVDIEITRKGRLVTSKADVVANNKLEFAVRPHEQIDCNAGDVWSVSYCLGGATWQFSVITISFVRGDITLSHSDEIRFVNKRRFLRISVSKPAMIAPFPALKQNYEDDELPQFRAATITELSGPGLRIMTNMNVKSGDRILVIFELEEGKIVEDVGEVRGVRDVAGNGSSIGVELVGLNDTVVNELVKATNAAAIAKSFADMENESKSEKKSEPAMAGGAVNG